MIFKTTTTTKTHTYAYEATVLNMKNGARYSSTTERKTPMVITMQRASCLAPRYAFATYSEYMADRRHRLNRIWVQRLTQSNKLLCKKNKDI